MCLTCVCVCTYGRKKSEERGGCGVGGGSGVGVCSTGSCRFALLLTGLALQRGCKVSGEVDRFGVGR